MLRHPSSADFASTMHALKLFDAPENWRDTWGESEGTFSSDIWFLQDDYLLEVQEIARLPEDAFRSLLQTAATIRSDCSLSRLAWHYRHLLFERGDDIIPWTFYIPSLSKYMGEQANLFVATVLCSSFRKTMDNCNLRGIPVDVLIETLADFTLWMNHHYEKYGSWGLETLWLYYHFSGRCYRLGRLQFVLDLFRGDVRVFRNPTSKRVVALAEPGLRFRRDGQVDGTNGVYDPDGAWTSKLEVRDRTVEGFQVSPHGVATKERVTLSLDEWELALSKGDLVLDIHIPEGEPLKSERCGESFRVAKDFFHRYFPEFDYKAFTCRTWLFDTQFQQMLPNSSNIVQFQREFFVYPATHAGSAIERIFGTSDLSKAPKQTLLQRAVYQHLSSGQHIRDAGGFILRADVAWGMQVYHREEADQSSTL